MTTGTTQKKTLNRNAKEIPQPWNMKICQKGIRKTSWTNPKCYTPFNAFTENPRRSTGFSSAESSSEIYNDPISDPEVFLFSASIFYIRKRKLFNGYWRLSLFFSDSFCLSTTQLPPMTTCDKPFSFLDFEAYCLHRSSFLKTCTARSQMAMSQNFQPPKSFRPEVKRENKLKPQKFLEQVVECN